MGRPIRGELVRHAPLIYINYDPRTEGGSINFRMRSFVKTDENERIPAQAAGEVNADFADILDRSFGEGTDPVTGADLSQISTAGVMSIIKAAFRTLLREQEAPPPEE